MIIPSTDGVLVSALDLQSAQETITQAIIDAGVGVPPLQGVQLDKLPGGNPAGVVAPDGQAYCWVIMADNAETIDVNTVAAVLATFAPSAKHAPTTAKPAKAKKAKAKKAK